MKNIEYLKNFNYYEFIKYIEIKLNERFHILNSTLYFDQWNFLENFIKFDFSNDFHFVIKFCELEQVLIKSKMQYDTYVNGLYYEIERCYLKETIKK